MPNENELKKMHRGDFAIITERLTAMRPRAREVHLHQAMLEFSQSSPEKSLDDWDKLLSATFLPIYQTLGDFFEQDTLWKQSRFEKRSALLDALAIALEEDTTKQEAIKLRRWYFDWMADEDPLIHPDSVMGVYLEKTIPPSSVHTREFSYGNGTLQKKSIEQYIRQMNPLDNRAVALLSCLLGPRLFEAKANARQHFFDPTLFFLRQCFWFILHTSQELFRQSTPQAPEHFSNFFETLHQAQNPTFEIRRLMVLLKHFVVVQSQAYPHLADTFKTTLASMMENDRLKESLLVLLEKLFQAIKSRSPLYAHLLMTPTEKKAPHEYTLAHLEKCAIDAEKERFKKEAIAFLTQATPSEKNYVFDTFRLHPKPLTITSTQEADDWEAISIEEIAQHVTDYAQPLDNPYDGFHFTAANECVAQLFLAHGATLPFSKESHWTLLKEAIRHYSPKNFQDAVFREAMWDYCHDEAHEYNRFKTLQYALKTAQTSPEKTFFTVALAEAKKIQRFYERDSRLLKRALAAYHMDVSLAMNFWLSVPTFFEPRQPSHPSFHQVIMATEVFTPQTARTFAYRLKDERFANLILDGQPFHQYRALKTKDSRYLFDYFLRALPYYTDLEGLYANGIELTDETFMPFLRSIASLKKLQVLSLQYNYITDKSLIAFSEFMKSNVFKKAEQFIFRKKLFKSLIVLDLSHNLITDQGALALFACLDCFPHLKSIEWGDNIAISDAYKATFSREAGVETHFLNLRDSSLTEVDRPSLTRDSLLQQHDNDTNPMRKSIHSPDTSRESSFSSDFRRSRTSSSLSKKSPTNHSFSSTDSSPSLLSLSFSELSDKAMTYKNIEQSNALTEEQQQLAQSYVHQKKLHFPQTIMEEAEEDRDETMDTLIRYIEKEGKHLEAIEDLNGKTFTLSQFEQLLDALKQVKKLKRLSLSDVTVLSDDGIKTDDSDTPSLMIRALVAVLPALTALETVDFGNKDLSSADFKALIDIVPKTDKTFKAFLINDDSKSRVGSTKRLFDKLTCALAEKETQRLPSQPSSIPCLTQQTELKTAPEKKTFTVLPPQPCALMMTHSIPDAQHFNHHKNKENLCLLHYVIVEHPNHVANFPKKLFFVNQEGRKTTIKPMTYHLEIFFEWVAQQFPALNTHHFAVLSIEQLISIKSMIHHDPYQEESYQLFSMEKYVDQIAIEWEEDPASLKQAMREMKHVFCHSQSYPERATYFDRLFGGLKLKSDARALLSTGLFTSNEKGQLGTYSTYADYLATGVTIACPVIAPASVGFMIVAAEIDTLERETFNQQMAWLYNDENNHIIFFMLSLLVLLRHVDQGDEDRMTIEQADQEIDQIIDFLSHTHSPVDPIIAVHQDNLLMLRKIPLLMQQLFGTPHCVIPMKPADYAQCQESLQAGIVITQGECREYPMPKTLIYPCSHQLFKDINIAENLREDEQALRHLLIHLAQSYRQKWRSCSFYQRCFIQYVQFHGGQDIFRCCMQLEQFAKTLTYYQLLEKIPVFLKDIEHKSGNRKESFQTQLIEKMVKEKPDATVKYCLSLN